MSAVIAAFVILVIASILFVASRYKRCPSDKILVIFGKVGKGQSARCIHGGGVLVWPLIQDSAFLKLESPERPFHVAGLLILKPPANQKRGKQENGQQGTQPADTGKKQQPKPAASSAKAAGADLNSAFAAAFEKAREKLKK